MTLPFGNESAQWSNCFALSNYATLFEIFSTTFLKMLTNERCFYCNELFFVWINWTFLFRFSFGFVLIVFLKCSLWTVNVCRRKLQEKCNWATHLINFKLKIFHQKHSIKCWNRVKLDLPFSIFRFPFSGKSNPFSICYFPSFLCFFRKWKIEKKNELKWQNSSFVFKWT